MLVHLQILRFIAAAAVVAFHAWGVAPTYTSVPNDAFSFGFEHGGHGVDLFFVISGFIIFYATHRALHDGKLTSPVFLRRRVERIVPLYFVVTAVVTTLALTWPAIFGAAGDWYGLRHILKSLGFISFTDGEMPVVYLGWSLEYEMYFYLVVAALMATAANVWRNVVVLFSALVIVGQLPGAGATLGHYFFLVHPLLLEFVLGVVAAKLFVERRLKWPDMAAPACALAALLIFDPSNRAVLFGLPSAALVYAAACLSRWRTAPSRVEHALERLGDASYSIYLAQVQTVSFACMGIVAVAPGMPPALLVLIVTAIVVAFGFVVNVLVERPLLRLCRLMGAREKPRDLPFKQQPLFDRLPEVAA